MILASSTTWRSTMSCMDLRKDSTDRSSAGKARTTITPDCALTITLRPSAEPTIALTDFMTSPQKLLSEDVVTRVLSVSRCDGAPEVTEAGAPGAPTPAVGASVIEPELTRT